MPAPYTHRLQDGWTRFMHGAFECTVVTDGLLHTGDPNPTLIGADRAEISALLAAAYLPANQLDMEQNVLVVNTGEALIMFDPGSGIDPAFGTRKFGPQVGRTIPNLRLAGIGT